jgi:hypothetical protein
MTVKIELPKANLLDRAIQYVSPRHYLRRMRARFALNLQGGYVGARTEREALRNWEPGTGSADADSLIDLPELRARTRDLDRNSGIARGATNTKVTSVVGTGLRVSAQVDRDLLGLSEEQATAWERQVRDYAQLDILETETVYTDPARPLEDRIRLLVQRIRRMPGQYAIVEDPRFRTRGRQRSPETDHFKSAAFGAAVAAAGGTRIGSVTLVTVQRWYPRGGRGQGKARKEHVLARIRAAYPALSQKSEHVCMAVGIAEWWSRNVAPRIWDELQRERAS